jgi:hypothetical protein
VGRCCVGIERRVDAAAADADECERSDQPTVARQGITNEALPQTVEHVEIYADLSVGLRLGLVRLYVVLPRLRRGVALTGKS